MSSALALDHVGNLMATPEFAGLMRDAEGGLRRTVSLCAEHGSPAPALSSALAYFDTMRTARGAANMIQIQRDFFGRHGFERLDRDGRNWHGPWDDA